jgi:hypothetical protein
MWPIFQKLGGDDAALDLIAQHRGGDQRGGMRPNSVTLKRWRAKGIPSHVKGALMQECLTRGIEFANEDMEWQRKPRKEAAE